MSSLKGIETGAGEITGREIGDRLEQMESAASAARRAPESMTSGMKDASNPQPPRSEIAGPRPLLEGLESEAPSQLPPIHDELDHILQQVDEISRSLNFDFPERQKLRDALQMTVACAVRQTLLERELRDLALRDDLTGLFNRRGFWASATQHLKLARRNSQEALLFFCDIDNLKTINDSFGHGAGDLALMRAADVLKATFRESDVAARFGGDEFAVLALATSSQYQESVLNRLQTNLDRLGVYESRYRLAMSVGIVRFDPALPSSLPEMVEQADQAMYRQKQNRRP
jgi:diguanylate cyclase (GGDEF)-like protein